MKKTSLIIFIFLFVNNLYSQQYKVFGNAATYRGETLELYIYSDNITKTKKVISTAEVADNGNFSFVVTEKDTIPAFIDLDVFIGKLIIEPGRNLEIVLPKRTSRSEADRLNPYFKPFEFYIRVLNNENCATSKIREFNIIYNETFKKYLQKNKYINSGEIEQKIIKVKEKIAFKPNSYIGKYYSYKFLYLRHLTFYKNKKGILRKDFSHKPLLQNNPAYTDMIDEIFSSIIFETNGNDLYEYLSSDYGWNAYMNLLKKDTNYSNKEFREYIFLHNLYNLFYKKRAYQNAILKILHSARESSISENSKIIVDNIINKVSKLIIGNPAPNFMLKDDTGFETSLNDFEDNFIYICFYNNDSYACKKDISALNQLNKKELEGLKIITIYAGEDLSFIKNLKSKNNYDWTFLRCDNNANVLKDYKVIAYPTYYLINPEGKLALLPAPAPSGNFESAYFRIYLSWKRNKLRNN